MKVKMISSLKRHPFFFGMLLFSLSLCISLHLYQVLREENVEEIEITLRAEHLPPEVCEALASEERLLLDGRFSLCMVDTFASPTPLRFYDANDHCEFTVPSKKYTDVDITLRAVAREHPFGAALYGVRTVNVGMHLSLYGERCKIYGTCIDLRPAQS